MSETVSNNSEVSLSVPVLNLAAYVYIVTMALIIEFTTPSTWWYDYSKLSTLVRVHTTIASLLLAAVAFGNLRTGYRSRRLNRVLIVIGVFFAVRCIIGF